MWIALALLLLILLAILFEYRIRKPDEILVYESGGVVQKRKGRFYPRHFSLALTGTIHSTDLKIEAEAKGKIIIQAHLVATVSASANYLDNLIRAGGWRKDTVTRATTELENLLQVTVKAFSEKQKIEDLSAENVTVHLQKKIGSTVEAIGLDIVSLNVYAIEPVDEKIAEAIQQRETARIIEETEKANQKARITAAEAKLAADERIAKWEHDLEMKKFKIRKVETEEEAKLANMRVREEVERRKLQLEFDRKEVDLIKSNPELLMLTPQAARLAEASQNLPNARTVVNLAGNEGLQGNQLLNLFQIFLQNLVESSAKTSAKKKKSEE